MTAATPRKMFVNLAVGDLKKSMAFFSALGFGFNPKFTDEKAGSEGCVRSTIGSRATGK